MSKIDYTQELAQILKFTGAAATAIRMYSAYGGGRVSAYLGRKPNAELEAIELMFLADALHNFQGLGLALESRDPTLVLRSCEDLLQNYAEYFIDRPERGLRQGRFAFEVWRKMLDPEHVMAALRSMRDKAREATPCPPSLLD